MCDFKLKEDLVNHPPHYNKGKIETIDYIESVTSTFEDGFEGVCVGNIIKYVSRFNFKNGVEDLEKAQWYLNKLVDYEKQKEKKANGQISFAEMDTLSWDEYKEFLTHLP